MPVVIKAAIINFFFPNFKRLSLTLEQKTATKTTDKALQDSNIRTTG